MLEPVECVLLIAKVPIEWPLAQLVELLRGVASATVPAEASRLSLEGAHVAWDEHVLAFGMCSRLEQPLF